MVEYFALDYPIKSPEAKKAIEQIEQAELERKEFLLPLNIDGNKHPAAQKFLAELQKVRKSSKMNQG